VLLSAESALFILCTVPLSEQHSHSLVECSSWITRQFKKIPKIRGKSKLGSDGDSPLETHHSEVNVNMADTGGQGNKSSADCGFLACSVHGIPVLTFGSYQDEDWANIGRLCAAIGGMQLG
jgi:hypothetical protein